MSPIDLPYKEKPRLLYLITRADRGGAQAHVLHLACQMRSTFEVVLATGEEGYLTEACRAQGIPVHVIPHLQREISPLADVRAVWELIKLLRQVRPSLVHAHTFKAGFLGRFASYWLGVPSIYTIHSWLYGTSALPPLWSLLGGPCESLASRWCEQVITVCDAGGKRARTYMNPAKLTTIHIGIPDCSARAGACAEAPVITMVARFCVPKDHALLLSAFAKLPSGPRLRLIGDGPLRRTCEQLADRLGIADRIEWLCDCTDVRTLLAESDVFVLTSRSEMLPVSILEAMCAALPVVASDVGGISEAVEHGQTGWLVPPDSESALRGALLTLLGDRDLRRRLGEAGRRRFEERFASHVQQQRMHNLYLDVLIRRPQADPKARRYAPAVPTYGDD